MGKIWLVLHLLKRLYLGCCRDDLDKILRRHYQMMDVWEGCRALHRYFKPQLYQIGKSWFCVQVCKKDGRQHSDSSRREFIISSRAVARRTARSLNQVQNWMPHISIFLSFFLFPGFSPTRSTKRERERETLGDYKRRHGGRGHQVRSLTILSLPWHEDYMLKKKTSLVCVTVTKLIRLNLAARGQNIENSDA